jgi:hypothetical protein
MKKTLLFILIACANSVYAQQKTVIKDSVLLSVLNNFIDDLKLQEKTHRLVKIRVVRLEKELNIKSVEKTNIGKITGEKVESEYVINYTFALQYPVNWQSMELDPVSYYAVHRDIPILIVTGVEGFFETNKKNDKDLMREFKKASSPNIVLEPVIWMVEVRNKKASIRKSSD